MESQNTKVDVDATQSPTTSKVSGDANNNKGVKKEIGGRGRTVFMPDRTEMGVGDQKTLEINRDMMVADGRTITPNHEYCWPWSIGVDEHMSWGALWFPCWDVDFLGEAYHRALYDDVVYYDDVWELRSTAMKISGSLETYQRHNS